MPGGLAAGQLVDERYALEERLEEDALGTVWRAHDRGLGRTVCLRDVRFPDDLFEQEPLRRQQALQAARTAIRLDHPHAVHVYDAFVDGDHLVVVTELVKARSLAAVVQRKGALPARRVAVMGLDLVEPLVTAHAIGLVHGSVSPSVVLVPDRGPCLLTGLGLAPPFSDAASTRWVEVAGTPSCVAPEQAKLHGSSPAADLWSLGATLYFAVEGSHAFTGASPAEILDAIANGEPRRPSHARELGPLLERLLVEDPEGRPDADEVRRELAHVAGIAVAEEAPAPSRRRGWRRARPSPAEPETGPETVDVEPEVSVEEAGRDWNAVVEDRDVDGTAADGNLSWVDWSPFDTSPPSAEPAASEAEPAPTADVPPEPAAAVPPASPEEEPPRYRSTPSWPPPARRRVGVTILCALVTVVLLGLLITDGRIGRSNARTRSTVSGQERPVLATDPASVPASWIAYHHPVVDFGISYPPGWTIREEGPVVTIREPTTGTELRVDYKQPPGEDPQRTWTNLESSFSTRHPGDYRRLQLSPATYLGHPAALWEFTYADGTVPAHAVDLGFLTKKYRFALYFQAPAATWDSMLPVFRAFLSSVQAPK